MGAGVRAFGRPGAGVVYDVKGVLPRGLPRMFSSRRATNAPPALVLLRAPHRTPATGAGAGARALVLPADLRAPPHRQDHADPAGPSAGRNHPHPVHPDPGFRPGRRGGRLQRLPGNLRHRRTRRRAGGSGRTDRPAGALRLRGGAGRIPVLPPQATVRLLFHAAGRSGPAGCPGGAGSRRPDRAGFPPRGGDRATGRPRRLRAGRAGQRTS